MLKLSKSKNYLFNPTEKVQYGNIGNNRQFNSLLEKLELPVACT